MKEQTIEKLLCRQRRYFASGATKPVSARMNALTSLERGILRHKSDLCLALQKDLGKSYTESLMCEIGLVLEEIRWMKKHLKGLCRPQRVRTPLVQFAAKSFRSPSPYGNVLIMSPWNYPILLTLCPLADALAAGNTAMVKPSAYAPASCGVLAGLLEECFSSEYVAVITGGREENRALLAQKFDKIFFTGSISVGKFVMESAARHLTPVALELGGKSPCIVEKSCNLKLAAKRIVFGKFINCGQTCVAPDYILCDASIKDALLGALREEIQKQYGSSPLANPNYGKIVNEKHFNRLLGLMDPAKVVYGGQSEKETLQIEPTLMDLVTWEDAVMQEEIFGPILPVISYSSLKEALRIVEERPRPLALYCFTENKKVKEYVLSRCRFGGGCINDTIIHLATSEMPFGGVGESGMGGYHGKCGFEEFSHYRSIVDKKTWLDLPIRYQPFTGAKQKILEKLFL